MNSGLLGFPRTSLVSTAPDRVFRSGQYYANGTITSATGSHGAGVCFFSPFPVGRTTLFDRLASDVSTGAATAIARLGIYSDSGDGVPYYLLLEAGTIDASTSGQKDIVIASTLKPGLYWLALQTEVASATWRRITASVGSYWYLPESAAFGASGGIAWIMNTTAGALRGQIAGAVVASALTVTNVMPRMFLRAA